MRIYGEAVFDVLYLLFVISAGLVMIFRSHGAGLKRLYGVMAVVLGCGDAFHLVPRVAALLVTGDASNTPALGLGKLITSVSMTVFYIILFEIWLRYFKEKRGALSLTLYALALCRIILCLMPQNDWFAANPPVLWGIIRNIPFAIMGVIMIMLFWRTARRDRYFKFMWLAVFLSFLFYIPVVLWADVYPDIGLLMIPKTLAYVWIVIMGLRKDLGKAK